MNQAVFPAKLSNPALLRTQSYIDGKWVDAKDGSHFAVDNPATGATIVLAAMGCFIVTLGVKATRGITASANRDEVNGKSVVRVRNG